MSVSHLVAAVSSLCRQAGTAFVSATLSTISTSLARSTHHLCLCVVCTLWVVKTHRLFVMTQLFMTKSLHGFFFDSECRFEL